MSTKKVLKEALTIPGPAGQIEVLLDAPQQGELAQETAAEPTSDQVLLNTLGQKALKAGDFAKHREAVEPTP